MPPFRRLTIATLAAVAAGSAIAVGAAAAQTAVLDLQTTVHGTGASGVFELAFSSGVSAFQQTEFTIESGSIGNASVGWRGRPNFVTLDSFAPFTARIDEWVKVGAQPLIGSSSLPPGTSATLVNSLTEQRFTLASGQITIPTGLKGPRAKPPAGGTRAIACHGTATSCTATIPIAGGAANRTLIIRLTDTNLRLLSVTAVPHSSEGAYLLTSAHLALGGSQYIVTLNAVKANPNGSHLVLKFGT